jgi:hypothetical protein
MWTFLTGQRGSRLIVNQPAAESTAKTKEPALVASRNAVAVATSNH